MPNLNNKKKVRDLEIALQDWLELTEMTATELQVKEVVERTKRLLRNRNRFSNGDKIDESV